jgi:tetratricopeptide (TPR) repeat protein
VIGKYYDLPDATADAERSLQRAQALSPDLPLLHKYYAQLECDAGRAIDALRRLLRRAQAAADPELFAGLVHACRYTGLLDASVTAHEEARRLDPTIQTSVFNTYSMRRDWDRIVREASDTDRDISALALYRLGRGAEALAAWPGVPDDVPAPIKAWDEAIRACLSGRSDAQELVERMSAFGSWHDPEGYMSQAIILSRLGSRELAIRLIADAVAGGFTVPETLANDPWLSPLRTDARFDEVLARASARCAEALAVYRAEGGERLLGPGTAG